ncbi:SHOCT-like domain-containing protein [Clostridium brassicae]|uniref:YvlB/LiaX N-terminal domain-containing protein n=1 Tax=Clostridium brassicae TaxID=2999072 RepID=A0ABT4D567_9CLOT|nr:hypothetical protein [Clostridium brassicae]MCY6957419.1 hypothetical protein [Clostridium brassicae]
MKEEISRILKMLDDGKIDSEKAAELISAIKGGEKLEQPINLSKSSEQEKMLKIKVKSKNGDNVDIKLSIAFVKGMLGIAGKIPGINKNNINIDPEIILNAIDNNMQGKIVDVHSSDGDIVEVVIE